MTPDRPQKIKLLRLLDLLQRETDVDHPISRQNLCKRLNDMGISSNLRTLSLDIETLNDAGYEIMENQVGHEKFYYVEDRDFSLPELKVLIDAVEAASFISKKRSDELVEKIASLGGEHRADLLKRNMVCFNTRKHSNNNVLFSVDSIEDAICRKKKVAFHYFDLDEKGERVFRTKDTGETKRYYVEPVALVFNEDNYYLVTYSSRHPDKTANYRVDRMAQVEVVEESVLTEEATAKIDSIAKYTEQAFKMYSGEPERVVIEFEKGLIGPVFDKFGEETHLMQLADNKMQATVDVQVSKTFFGWLAQFGSEMKIIEPDNVKEKYIEHISEIIDGEKKND